MIGATAGTVGGKVVAPVVEADTVRVGAVVGVEAVLEGARVKSVHGAVAVLLVFGPGRFHIADVEHAALVVEVAVRAVHESVGTVVGVGAVQAVEQADAHVGHVVAVGVLEEQNVRHAGHDDAAVPEFKSGGVVHFGEGDGLVRHAVAILIREDQQAVVHFLERFPLGVGGPGGGPEAALGIHSHLHGVGHFGEHFLGSKDIHLEALGQLQLGGGFVRGDVNLVTFFLGVTASGAATDVGFHADRLGHIGIIHLIIGVAVSVGPDFSVAVGDHYVDHIQLVHQHVAVGLAIDKLESSAASPNVITIGGSVAVVPVPVLVQHSLADTLHFLGVLADFQTEHFFHQMLSDQLVAAAVGVDAVEGKRLLVHHVKMLGNVEEIHVGQFIFGGGHFGGAGILHQAGVVSLAVRQVGGVQVFVHDRRTDHQSRGPFAAVVLL